MNLLSGWKALLCKGDAQNCREIFLFSNLKRRFYALHTPQEVSLRRLFQEIVPLIRTLHGCLFHFFRGNSKLANEAPTGLLYKNLSKDGLISDVEEVILAQKGKIFLP